MQGSGEDKEMRSETPCENRQVLSYSGYLCSMEVNDALVQKLANLAKLDFSESEYSVIRTDLQRMISFVEKLGEPDLTGIPPRLFMTDEINVLRDDEVTGSVTREEGLKNAPAHDSVFFKVPKAIVHPGNAS